MAARAIKSATIQFGMVNIPIKLYNAVDDKSISFNRLHNCESGVAKVKQKHWCPECDVEVEYADLAKGYEYAKGQFITINDEDLEQLPVPSKESIEISQFVDSSNIDPILFEKAYVVEPEDVAKKSFALLVQSMQAKDVVAIATVTIRTKERVCALRLREGVLILQTLHTTDEIKSFSPVETPALTDRELGMASGLIDMMTTEDFDVASLRDSYREALTNMIAAKLDGNEAPVITATKSVPTVDLMDALTASMALMQEKKAEAKAAKPAVTKKAAAKAKA